MTGKLDRLVHACFGTDYVLVWDVVVNKIPTLRRQIAEMPSLRSRGRGPRQRGARRTTMTAHRDLKNIIRQRQKKTGESYTAARM